MSQVATTGRMTIEEMLDLPDDGHDRELIRGELREEPTTFKDRHHSRTETRIAHRLETWLETQAEPRGEVVSGDAGFRLKRDPDSFVGMDVAYVSWEIAAIDPDAAFFEGPPILAVEILSPSDTQERIDEKIALYLETGVLVVWVVSPRFRTVTVFRPDAPPALFNDQQELDGGPHLPGFRVEVAKLFGAGYQ